MTLIMALRSFFEFSAIILLIVGFWHEKEVIAFEEKLFRAIRIRLRRRHNRKALANRQAARTVPAAKRSEEFRPFTVKQEETCSFSRVA